MAVEVDTRGRVYLPKAIRDKHGERYRVVDRPDRVVLIPVDADPLEAARAIAGDAFGDAARADAIEAVQTNLEDERADR